ncbi:MAG: bifunctional diaminohydroxyphosphoribosylaminopyrimidine deaminase/5-amino-6-(5-phosphoribosylamino)uracil reductase RibD [Bacteroidales bacterium]|nr:bifunctional diaminohydroxyphosphoribosylaminopyrimidine deaminase/5-amino-6-(5-phosphoribosylamino)uracil reductase RibD [Bacteroidales bacterium]
MITERDKIYMRRCFELARKGLGMTMANPLVGAIIVHNDRIIGEGYHHEFGGPHAEVNAIRSVKDPTLLSESTLYCSLEPCSHHGKTPPCSILIQQKGLRRVVVSNLDPFPSVNGKGIKYLEDAGIEVERDCLEEEGFYLNRRFFHYINYRRPYVILKWAQTADRFIDLEREPGDQEGPRWISNEVCRTLVHKWRSEESAIMVGTNTILSDNPSLNVRRWSGENPVRITLDRNGRLTESAQILDGTQETIVFTGVQRNYSGKIQTVHADPSYEMVDVMEELFDRQIVSVFVEGGAKLHNTFLESGLWDEARVFTGKMLFTQGVIAPEIDEKPDETVKIGDTKLEVFRNKLSELHGS